MHIDRTESRAQLICTLTHCKRTMLSTSQQVITRAGGPTPSASYGSTMVGGVAISVDDLTSSDGSVSWTVIFSTCS